MQLRSEGSCSVNAFSFTTLRKSVTACEATPALPPLPTIYSRPPLVRRSFSRSTLRARLASRSTLLPARSVTCVAAMTSWNCRARPASETSSVGFNTASAMFCVAFLITADMRASEIFEPGLRCLADRRRVPQRGVAPVLDVRQDFPDPVFERDARRPAELALDAGNIGPGAIWLARPFRHVDHLAAEQLDQPVHRLRISSADI